MITSIRFENFKSFRRYSIALNDTNIMVGPNNAGKSSILDALRILNGAYRYASRYKPHLIELPGGATTYGYQIPESSIPVAIEHVHTDLNREPTHLHFRISNGRTIIITFSPDRPTILHFNPGKTPRTAKDFRNEFPINLAIIPPLGPLESEESLHDADYVQRWSTSHRAPRIFRNMWFYDSTRFDEFRVLLEQTWPGMSISLPEKDSLLSTSLRMFCLENRMTREISWAGNGFQIWVQMLTHIVKAEQGDLIVIDEPEIYLHPDLQRKVISVLKGTSRRILIATHSVEIINEVDPEDVLIVDKSQPSARRIKEIPQLQESIELLGSTQNMQLARLARSKRILFVEGKDVRMLRLFARVAKRDGLFDDSKLTVVPVGGFSEWERVSHTKWAFSKIIDEDMKICVLFDKDYRCDDEISEFRQRL